MYPQDDVQLSSYQEQPAFIQLLQDFLLLQTSVGQVVTPHPPTPHLDWQTPGVRPLAWYHWQVDVPSPKVVEVQENTPISNKTVVAYHYENVVPAEDLELLEKILDAIQMKPDDVENVNTSSQVLEVKGFTGCQIIAFGIPDAKLEGSYTSYENSTFGESKIIVSNSLAELSARVVFKRALWGALNVTPWQACCSS